MITSSTGRRRDLKRSVLKPVGRSLRRHREAGSSEMWSWRRVPSERSSQKELIVGHPQENPAQDVLLAIDLAMNRQLQGHNGGIESFARETFRELGEPTLQQAVRTRTL